MYAKAERPDKYLDFGDVAISHDFDQAAEVMSLLEADNQLELRESQPAKESYI